MSQQPNNEIDQLRLAVKNENLPMQQRRDAAAHLVQLKIDAVPSPAEDDADVLELQRKWPTEGLVNSSNALAQKVRNEGNGWQADGPTVMQAQRHVRKERQRLAILTVIVDDDVDVLEQLAACQNLLDAAHEKSFWKMNTFDAARVMTTVISASATKYNGLFKPRIPVVRPPTDAHDVFPS